MNIDWVELAIDNIDTQYNCPICDYHGSTKSDVEGHIRAFHKQEEIKRICSA